MKLIIETNDGKIEMDSEDFGMMSWVERLRVGQVTVNGKGVNLRYNNKDGRHSIQYKYSEIGPAAKFIRDNFIAGETLWITPKKGERK